MKWVNESRYKQDVKEPFSEDYRVGIGALSLCIHKTTLHYDGKEDFVADCQPFFSGVSVGLGLADAKDAAVQLLLAALTEHSEQIKDA